MVSKEQQNECAMNTDPRRSMFKMLKVSSQKTLPLWHQLKQLNLSLPLRSQISLFLKVHGGLESCMLPFWQASLSEVTR